MLQAEYARIGRPPLDLAGKKIVDAFRLWQQCEPRSLQHAHRRFVGDEFAAAHSASADVAATGRVLVGHAGALRARRPGLGRRSRKRVRDPRRARAGSVRRATCAGRARSIVIGFGKHTGMPLHELAAGPDRSFLRWVIEKDFPPHVGEILPRGARAPWRGARRVGAPALRSARADRQAAVHKVAARSTSRASAST